MPAQEEKSVKKFRSGDHLVRADQVASALFIIRSGQLEVYKNAKDGSKLSVALIGSGEFVGETAVLLGDNYSSSVVALTDVEALVIPKETVEAQLKQVPGWLNALTKGLIDRLRRANDLLRKHEFHDEGLESRIEAIRTNHGKKQS